MPMIALGALIDAYNKIQNDQSREQHFQHYKQLVQDAFDKANKI
jgi:capsule polysaccharide export protein KpsE/RkpR